jgi:exodeoxyribonuclease-3
LRSQAPKAIADYHFYLNPALKAGYAGTALLTKIKPKNVSFEMYGILDIEGRTMVAELEKFIMVNVYTPSVQHKRARIEYREFWDEAFTKACVQLDKKKPVIIAGDLNVAQLAIESQGNPNNCVKSPGFTWIEKYGYRKLLEGGFVDSISFVHSTSVRQEKYWSKYGNPAESHMGWRHDYVLVSNKLKLSITGAEVERYVGTSDHCPVTATLYLRGM